MKDVLKAIEDEFNCNGICDAGPFYLFRAVTDGPPQKDCMTGIKDAFKDKPLAIGIILLVSAFLTIFAFITVYGLCYRKDKH